MAVVGRFRDLERELTVQLYRSQGEDNHARPEDVLGPLQELGLDSRLRRKNPATHNAWSILVELVTNPGLAATLGAALFGALRLWVKAKEGRRIEINRKDHRGDLKMRASTAKDLEKAFSQLAKYDALNFNINTVRKKRVRKQ